MLELDSMPLHGTSTHLVCMNIRVRDQAQMNYIITMLTAGCSSCTSS